MEQIIAAFGIDWRLIMIQLINFGLLLAVLTYYLYKPILKAIDERKATVAKGIEDAKNAGEKLALASEESAVIVSSAHKDADGIVSRAKDVAKKDASGIVGEAHNQSEKIVLEARSKALADAERIRKDSEKEIAATAILAAEAILREKV